MSDLQRSFAKVQRARLPLEPPTVFDERDEIDEHDELDALPQSSRADSSSSASSTGTIIPSPSRNLFERPTASTSRSRSEPLPWQDYFARRMIIETTRDPDIVIKHNIYLTPPSGTSPVFVTHHGAGSSALSFASFSREIQKAIPSAGVLAFDARGHGETTVQRRNSTAAIHLDLTLDTLAIDLQSIVKGIQEELKWPSLPDIVLLGHSLGGAVVTEVAHKNLLGNSLLGYGVLDVVEGSAMDALKSMDQYLITRPTTFPSITSAIEWHIKSRTIRNSQSARVSVPPLLIPQSKPDQPTRYIWRTDLATTKPFWENWFVGLSSKFLSSRGGKLLILAGTDRLDRELMIGQMQGKYQLQVFPEAGHFLHEDQPEKTAGVVAEFFRRNDRSALVLPPKVDDLIRQGKMKGLHS